MKHIAGTILSKPSKTNMDLLKIKCNVNWRVYVKRTGGGKKMERRMREVEEFLKELPRNMSEEFVKNTPIRSGNARSKTTLKGGDSIAADYGYAGSLMKGTSKQAPQGMTDPTIDWVRGELRKL
jgi:hypothetical protein